MVFFLPQSTEYAHLRILIEKHGGLVSEFHECFTYQIAPISYEVPKTHYFWGDVFTGNWIVDSIKAGRLLDKESYLAFHNREKNSLRVEFVDSKVKYTITEGIKVFEIAIANI